MKAEKLSQLLDGELEGPELEAALDALLADPKLQQSWLSIHSMRAAVHETGVPVVNSISSKVSAALDLEPEIMAPNNIALDSLSDQTEPVVPAERKRPNVIKYVALAASVAALTMVFYSPFGENRNPVAQSTGVSAMLQASVAPELQSMIVQHGEFSGVAALNGLVAYAQVVNDSAANNGSQ